MSTKVTPPSKNIRLTITVTREVHEGFERLAAASGLSLSRCMGEWLGDTLEAVEYTANMVEKARAAPKMVMREVHAYAMGLADETGALLDRVAAEGRRQRSDGGARAVPPTAGGGRVGSNPISPPSNTGGKPPTAVQRKRVAK